MVFSCLLQKKTNVVLQNLRSLQAVPPNVNVSISSEISDSLIGQNNQNTCCTIGTAPPGIDIALDGVNWTESTDVTQIDWDIGSVEQPDESVNLGSYEIINSNEELQDHKIINQNPINKQEDDIVTESEICWDVSIENPKIDVLEDALPLDSSFEALAPNLDALSQQQIVIEERSQLLDTEYRNKILDDLFEVIVCLVLFYPFFVLVHLLQIYLSVCFCNYSSITECIKLLDFTRNIYHNKI